jgi:hypothetical protein
MEVFDLASWINSHGAGYPHSGPPQEVVKERRRLLCIPAEIRAQIPSCSVPINDISFPPTLDVPIPMKSTDIFSSLPPILDHSVITALPLPPLLYTNHVFKALIGPDGALRASNASEVYEESEELVDDEILAIKNGRGKRRKIYNKNYDDFWRH